MSDRTDQIQIGRIVLSIFSGIYGVIIIIMLVYGSIYKNQYNSMMDNLYDYYYMSMDDILRLDWVINGDHVLYQGLLWSACLALISALFSAPYKRTDRYSRYVIVYLIIVGILRLITGFVGIGISNKTRDIKTELSLNFEHYMDFEENRGIQVFMEEEHKCCGINGPLDYNRFNVSEYPTTCYDKEILFLIGCPQKIQNLYSAALRNFGLIFIFTGLYEALGAIPAYYLHRAINVPESTPV